jgi:outer membrane protein assembly factor BamB
MDRRLDERMACMKMNTHGGETPAARFGWALALFASISLLLGIGTARAASTAAESNWPQWRGPLGTGVAPNADPPVAWSETKNVRWKVKIPGTGSATPIVWEHQVFVQTAIPTGKKREAAAPGNASPPVAAANTNRPAGGRGGGMPLPPKPTEVYQFAVLGLDRQTGQVLWQQTAREEIPHEGFRANEGSFASSSGVTDGQHLYAFFGSRGLYCYDLKGKLEWSQDLGKMRIILAFGEGSSPALYGDMLIVNWDNEEGSFIIALDKNTGKTLWKQSREERTSWATPLVVEVEGKPQVITAATGKIRSYDLATGKIVWECGGLTRNVIPSPVAGNGLVYCMSGFQGNSLLAIKLGRTGDLTGTDAVAWNYRKSTPYVPSPLLYGDKLYFLASNNGILSCFDANTGRPLIDAERLEAVPGVYASPIGASGRVYLVGRNGMTVVLKHSGKLEVLAANQLEEKFDASPVAVGKELFLRGREYLYCLEEK